MEEIFLQSRMVCSMNHLPRSGTEMRPLEAAVAIG